MYSNKHVVVIEFNLMLQVVNYIEDLLIYILFILQLSLSISVLVVLRLVKVIVLSLLVSQRYL
jgi:hypothetical protein